MSIFEALAVYYDIDSRSAPLNMAIDEVILETATEPTIRFYRWDHLALSFGYSGRFEDVSNHEGDRDIVRSDGGVCSVVYFDGRARRTDSGRRR